jgi:hypothetical protein
LKGGINDVSILFLELGLLALELGRSYHDDFLGSYSGVSFCLSLQVAWRRKT